MDSKIYWVSWSARSMLRQQVLAQLDRLSDFGPSVEESDSSLDISAPALGSATIDLDRRAGALHRNQTLHMAIVLGMACRNPEQILVADAQGLGIHCLAEKAKLMKAAAPFLPDESLNALLVACGLIHVDEALKAARHRTQSDYPQKMGISPMNNSICYDKSERYNLA